VLQILIFGADLPILRFVCFLFFFYALKLMNISNRYLKKDIDHERMESAYLRELAHFRSVTGPREVVSIFFGGGTHIHYGYHFRTSCHESKKNKFQLVLLNLNRYSIFVKTFHDWEDHQHCENSLSSCSESRSHYGSKSNSKRKSLVFLSSLLLLSTLFLSISPLHLLVVMNYSLSLSSQ
jgi:hypothetical protein